MPDSNTFLRSLVTGAQSICLEKLDQVKMTLGTDDATVTAAEKEMNRVFDGLANPDIWINPIDADSAPINDRVIALGNLPADKADQILTQIQQLLALLDQSILQPGLAAGRAAANTTPPTGMNIQVLNALSRTRQQAALRIFQFTQAGQDLQQDAEFQTMQTRQDGVVNTYREKLKTNAILSKITDVTIISQRGDLIASSANVKTFKLHYDNLSNFIQNKLNGA